MLASRRAALTQTAGTSLQGNVGCPKRTSTTETAVNQALLVLKGNPSLITPLDTV